MFLILKSMDEGLGYCMLIMKVLALAVGKYCAFTLQIMGYISGLACTVASKMFRTHTKVIITN